MDRLKKHYQAVADLCCIVCRNEGIFTEAQIHHPWGRKNGNEMKVIPLCPTHHQSGLKNPQFVSVHPWKRAFEARYGTEEELFRQVEGLL